MLIVLYLRTFGLSRPGSTTRTIDGKTDASGRTLRQRLDGSEASSAGRPAIRSRRQGLGAMIQLSYLSTAVAPMAAEPLSALLQQCLGYNPGHGITGLLLYGNGTFLQALEGEEDVVIPLYKKIARDPRHADVQCLNSRTIEARQYPEWSMGFRRMAEADLADVEGLRDFNKANFNADFLAANEEVREDIMSHYASWDPLLREVDEGERHVKHLQEVLRRAQGGIEIARLVLEGIVDAHATEGFGDRHAKMCTFALAQLSQI